MGSDPELKVIYCEAVYMDAGSQTQGIAGAILALEPQTHCSSSTITYLLNNDYTEGET